MRVQKKSGFTIIEILIVIGIIAALLAFVVPRIMQTLKGIKTKRTRMILNDLRMNLIRYREDMEKYPSTREGGLELLWKQPKPRGKWDGPYLTSFPPKDGWTTEIEYNSPPMRRKELGKYELISFGPDGEESDDDIIVGEKEL